MAKKRFLKGLFKDMSHIDQPEGTWRYAKNAIINEKKGVISNEGGTEISGHLPADDNQGNTGELWKAIGAIEIDKDRVILLSYNASAPNPNEKHSAYEIRYPAGIEYAYKDIKKYVYPITM